MVQTVQVRAGIGHDYSFLKPDSMAWPEDDLQRPVITLTGAVKELFFFSKG